VAHSFGIHVARLAGMPREVIASAEKTLKALEAGENVIARAQQTTKLGTVEDDGAVQLSFFQLDDPTLESLRDQLKGADLNNMTPLQAFDLLRSMKAELGI
jgi:DNA mismatch repair protein MutS